MTTNVKAMLTTKEIKLPENHKEILKNADTRIDTSSTEKMYDQLQKGVFLNLRRKKYWVDKNMKNCFMLCATDLSIIWGPDGRYWHWIVIKEPSGESVVGAELMDVCWFEVCGRFNTVNLTPETVYEVFFVVLLKERAYGWDSQLATLRLLILPSGSRKEHKEKIWNQPRGRWIEIPVGEFIASPENMGEMKISLEQTERNWKSGLVMKGLVIRPKN